MWRPTFPQIVIFSLLVQLAAQWSLPDSIFNRTNQDIDGYAAFASSLARHGVYGPTEDSPSAFRPPFYSLLLAPWFTHESPIAWGIVGLHLVATAGTLFFLRRIAHDLGQAAIFPIAGMLVAIDPLLLRQATLIMTETVFTALFVASISSWIRILSSDDTHWHSCGWTGLLTGLAALTRPIAWLFTVAILPIALFHRRARPWLLSCGFAGLIAVPWLLRNWLVLGLPILTTTHGGYTLWLGQNETYYREVVSGRHSIWPEASFELWTQQNAQATEGFSEIEKDVYFRQKALGWMTEHPSEALRSMFYHVRAFWSLMPNYGPQWGRFLCAGFYLVLNATALVGMSQRKVWRVPAIVLPLSLAVFTLCHAIYWSDMRMRAPLVPIIALLAGMGMQRMFTWIAAKHPPPKESV